MTNRAIICIGSNLSPRRRRVADALGWLRDMMPDLRASEIYETPEIHGKGRPYMNMVVSGSTVLDMDEIRRLTKEYEISAGRDMEARQHGDVPVDIDVVVWNGEIIRPGDWRQSFFRIGAAMIGIDIPVTV